MSNLAENLTPDSHKEKIMYVGIFKNSLGNYYTSPVFSNETLLDSYTNTYISNREKVKTLAFTVEE